MDTNTKKQVAQELFKNTSITKEQYKQFQLLVKDLDLDVPVEEESWEELIEALNQ